MKSRLGGRDLSHQKPSRARIRRRQFSWDANSHPAGVRRFPRARANSPCAARARATRKSASQVCVGRSQYPSTLGCDDETDARVRSRSQDGVRRLTQVVWYRSAQQGLRPRTSWYPEKEHTLRQPSGADTSSPVTLTW